ncbi:cilia- and flagella- associated protein 210 [Nelusetta ayraudi]|uniref:cilia- and flagella- associated protein 210 n=1 Tax=Nelusetta ayraudi TaxID=303726 RepID=UPI003F720E42
METAVQRGRRRDSGKKVSDEMTKVAELPDLRQILVLSKTDWSRIQDEMDHVDKGKERMIEEAKQREALHLQSVEVVKQWSDTFAGQRQKQLEAKKIRDEIERKKWEEIDKEEVEYQEQMRKEAIEKAKTQLFYQTHRVRGLHGALMLSEVLKEREAQVELKQRVEGARQDMDKLLIDVQKQKDQEATKKEQETEQQKKLERQAITEGLKQKFKENELVREQEKMEEKKDGENMQRLLAQHQWEQRMEKERQAEQKRDLMQAHMDTLSNRDLLRAAEAQKQEAEEQQRKLYLSAKEKIKKLRKDREAELMRRAQRRREVIKDKLTVTQREQEGNEEQRMAVAVAQRDAREAQLQWEEEERKAALLQSIAKHRELTRKEKEQKDKEAKRKAQEAHKARKEADRMFSGREKLKAQRLTEDRRELKAFNVAQMAEKSARRQRKKQEEQEFEEKKAEFEADEDERFRRYSHKLIQEATEAQLNAFPLEKAARGGGVAGSLEGVAGGGAPVYLVQDQSGAQMPQYVTGNTQSIKKLNKAADFEGGKKRLGFTWS